MAKSRKKEPVNIELYEDAWGRFERAAGIVGKSPPQHKSSKKKPNRRKKRQRGTRRTELRILGTLLRLTRGTA
jgi:hypothetical protein